MSVLQNDPPRCERCGSLYPDDPGAALACCSELEPINLDDVQEDDELRITFKDGHREKHSIDASVDEVVPSEEDHRDISKILVDVPELEGRARIMFGGSVDHLRDDRDDVLLGYGAELQRERDVATDGGLDEIPRRPGDLEGEQEPNLVQACPYCDHSDIYLRGRSDVGRPTPEDDHNYRCKNCKTGFFKPIRRPDRRRTRSGGGSA